LNRLVTERDARVIDLLASITKERRDEEEQALGSLSRDKLRKSRRKAVTKAAHDD
jgi:hypothetical protein